jgi:streptogramin lyase
MSFSYSKMLQILYTLVSLLASSSDLVVARAIQPRQSTATQVVKLASVENVATRSNGIILATNMNSPNLYSVDPAAKTSSTAVTVTGANGLSGIGEVTPDVFAVIGGKGIYKIDFTGTYPKASLVKQIQEATNLNGLAVLNNNTVLVADAGKGNVYRFSMSTGDYSVALTDSTMAPAGGIPFGIDGIKYKDGIVWYTNIFKNSFHKVPVDETGKATGAVTTLWTNLMGDDLCLGPNSKVYVTTNSRNSVVEVDTSSGKPTTVATVTGSTSCTFGRTSKDSDVIYVGGSQGVFAATIKI